MQAKQHESDEPALLLRRYERQIRDLKQVLPHSCSHFHHADLQPACSLPQAPSHGFCLQLWFLFFCASPSEPTR